MKETVGSGKFVAFAYRLYNDATGDLLFEATKEKPDMMIYGVSHEIVPGLSAALKDLGAGDKFEVTLPPVAAFGDRYEENVMELEADIFRNDEGEMLPEVKVGAELPMLTQEGYRVLGRVLEVDDKKVKMDFNHPFAGLTVRYDGEVIEVRDATPEELSPAKGCGCGCHGGCDHGDCGDCGSEGDNAGGCGCGDTCDCGSHKN